MPQRIPSLLVCHRRDFLVKRLFQSNGNTNVSDESSRGLARPGGPHTPAERPGAARGGSHLRPGWLRPARIRRTRRGTPSRQLSAVDTRRICPPCTEKRRLSGATALAAHPAIPYRCPGPGKPRPAGAHPLHDPAVYLHPVPVHGWR